jgi:3-mercaptopropionate dioxygenase
VVTGTNLNVRGTVDALIPPGDIHSVANASDGVAVSLHVYGVDLYTLGCSIRRNYQLPVRLT